MFDQLFTRPQARRRHVNSPLLKERLDYLGHRAEQGYKLPTLRLLAGDLLRIQNLLGLANSSGAIDPAALEVRVKRYVSRQPRNSHHKNERRKRIFSLAVHWLRFLKRLRLPSVTLPVYQPLQEDFAHYQCAQKGLSEATVRQLGGYVEDFLHGFFRNRESSALPLQA